MEFSINDTVILKRHFTYLGVLTMFADLLFSAMFSLSLKHKDKFDEVKKN